MICGEVAPKEEPSVQLVGGMRIVIETQIRPSENVDCVVLMPCNMMVALLGRAPVMLKQIGLVP